MESCADHEDAASRFHSMALTLQQQLENAQVLVTHSAQDEIAGHEQETAEALLLSLQTCIALARQSKLMHRRYAEQLKNTYNLTAKEREER